MDGAQVGASDMSRLRAGLRDQREDAAAARVAAARTRAATEQARTTAAQMRMEAAQMLVRLGELRVQDLRARARIAKEREAAGELPGGLDDARDQAPSVRLRDAEREELDEAADQREADADERDRVADQREADADERDRVADHRETEADERDQAADRRELVADERDRMADERALWGDQDNKRQPPEEHPVGDSHSPGETRQRTLEALKRARTRLADSRVTLDRSETMLAAFLAQRERREAQREEVDIAANDDDPTAGR